MYDRHIQFILRILISYFPKMQLLKLNLHYIKDI